MMELFRKYKKEIILGLAIFFIALFLRTYNLFAIPIFADEAIYIRWAQVMRAESTLRFLPLSDGKQPFFMWFVIPALKVIPDPLVAGRVVSIASGMLALSGIFLLGKRLFGTRAGLFAAFLYAISPISVFFDRIGLVDSLLTSLGICGLYFSVLAVQTLRLDFAMLAGFSFGAAWLTKSPAMFFLMMLPGTAILAPWRKKKNDNLFLAGKLIGLFSATWIIAVGMYNILRLGPNFHMIGLRNKDYVFGAKQVFANPFDPFSFHIKEVVEWLSTLLPWTVLVLVVLALVVFYRKNWRAFLLLVVWCIFPLIIVSAFAKVFTSRYILFATPPLFVLGGLGLAWISQRLAIFRLPVLFAALAIPILFNWLLLTSPLAAPLPRDIRSGHLEEWTSGIGIREVAGIIKEEKKKAQEVDFLVATEGFFGTLPDGLQIYIEDIPGITVKGVGITISRIDESMIVAKRAGNRVFLIVNASRFAMNPDGYFILLSSFPKAERPDGTRDSLLLFELVNIPEL